jgi:2,4-dienoyl-CoA reductase-like NADH-dependent reductase (Old Yellow Enzyme family)
MATLQDPIRIGDWELPNRVIMAPLTRCRASEGRVPNDLMRQYYQQRALVTRTRRESGLKNKSQVGNE